MKTILVAIMAIIVTLGFTAYLTSRPGTAIVEATILRVNPPHGLIGQYQLVVNATKAFPNFPLFTMSQCPSHNPGEVVFVGVQVANGWGGLPIWDEAKLFKEQGFVFVPWDGCEA